MASGDDDYNRRSLRAMGLDLSIMSVYKDHAAASLVGRNTARKRGVVKSSNRGSTDRGTKRRSRKE